MKQTELLTALVTRRELAARLGAQGTEVADLERESPAESSQPSQTQSSQPRKREVPDLERESLADSSQPSARQSSQPRKKPHISPAVRSQPSQELETPELSRERGLKRPSSFQTPTPKKLFQSPSSQDTVVRDRQLQELKETMPSDIPVFYRLDYLWGKAKSPEARPNLSPPLASQKAEAEAEARLQLVESAAEEAAARLGMQAAVPKARNKGGRPKGRKQNPARKALPGLRKKRADVTARGKLKLMKDVDRMIAAGTSKKEVKKQISKEFTGRHAFKARFSAPRTDSQLVAGSSSLPK